MDIYLQDFMFLFEVTDFITYPDKNRELLV